jgi:hypothetical protein
VVAGCSTRPPSAPAGGVATRSASDSALHPSQFLHVVCHCAKAATTTAQHPAALRLQVATRGFLARRRLQKAHKQMQDREAALVAVAFAFDAAGWTSTRLMATNNSADLLLCPRVCMVSFP